MKIEYEEWLAMPENVFARQGCSGNLRESKTSQGWIFVKKPREIAALRSR